MAVHLRKSKKKKSYKQYDFIGYTPLNFLETVVKKNPGNNMICKNLQRCQIENQQSTFYVVNRATLNHDYIKSHSKALGFGLQTDMK